MKASNKYFRLVGILMLSSPMFIFGLIKSNAKLEPGHFKQDYENIEEVKKTNNNIHSSRKEDKIDLKEEILDVGYYLRRFKFHGFDTRYSFKTNSSRNIFLAQFPSPSLENIHWEVKKNCEYSFTDCVIYLQKIVNQMSLPRNLDSLTIVKKNGWVLDLNKSIIRAADANCNALLKKEEISFGLFSGQMQKIQWLTSAIYYMCLFTMKEMDGLKAFADDCDNFASCIDRDFGIHNNDFRANNARPFACAFYSFCPDPCCPIKYAKNPTSCLEFSPCSEKGTLAKGPCQFLKKKNISVESVILNKWNVSCECSDTGMRWDAESGICIDVDECVENEFPCDFPSETCINLKGSYKCVCSFLGYYKNFKTNECQLDFITQNVLYPSNSFSHNKTEFWISTLFTFFTYF